MKSLKSFINESEDESSMPYKEAVKMFQKEYESDLKKFKKDIPAKSEMWNNWIDAMNKEGEISDDDADSWDQPKFVTESGYVNEGKDNTSDFTKKEISKIQDFQSLDLKFRKLDSNYKSTETGYIGLDSSNVDYVCDWLKKNVK